MYIIIIQKNKFDFFFKYSILSFNILSIFICKVTNIIKRLEKNDNEITEGQSDSIYFLFDALLRFCQLYEWYSKNNQLFNIYSDVYLKNYCKNFLPLRLISINIDLGQLHYESAELQVESLENIKNINEIIAVIICQNLKKKWTIVVDRPTDNLKITNEIDI
tara:strand:+ start:99 stop:584 length:486 start_codon:yes stop_codon:yes gene_type:complete